MSGPNGHIQLHRKLFEWEWYHDTTMVRVWIHLLLKANWKDGRFRGHTVPRGSFVCSSASLAQECSLGRQSVRTALSNLQDTGELTIKSTSRFSIYTIVNYDEYQGECNDPTTNLTNNQPTNQPAANQQLTTIEESKKVRKNKKASPRSSEDADPSLVTSESEKSSRGPAGPLYQIKQGFEDKYLEKYGKPYLWDGKHWAQAKHYLGYFEKNWNGRGLELALVAMGSFFDDTDPFLAGRRQHDALDLLTKPQKWAKAPEKPFSEVQYTTLDPKENPCQ